MSKSQGIAHIKSAASAGAHELAKKGMHKAARGLRVVGGATASIGRHVEGWDGELGGMMRGAPIGRRRKKRRKASSSSGGKKRRKGSRKRRSPAQMRAFRKMIAANPNRRRGRRKGKKKSGHRRRRKH